VRANLLRASASVASIENTTTMATITTITASAASASATDNLRFTWNYEAIATASIAVFVICARGQMTEATLLKLHFP
jgi:uncharacterized membrane protein